MGKTFDNSSLSGARFTYQNRIVLGAAAEYLQYAANLIVASYYRIELAATSGLVKIYGILAERLISLLGCLRSYLLALAQFGNCSLKLFFGYARLLKYP